MAAVPIGGQADADRVLLQYKDYDDYTDSLVTPIDLYYLRSTVTARTIAELGYRNAGETLSRNEFYERQKAVNELLYPSRKSYELCSSNTSSDDPVISELAMRERANRVGILATIIFIRQMTRRGYEISGYIDYGHRLATDNWIPFFEGKKRLWPRPSDLGYYNWRMGKSSSTPSPNYKVIVDPYSGLLFQNRHDRKVICVDPNAAKLGDNTIKTRVYSTKYLHIELYDHVVRRKAGLAN